MLQSLPSVLADLLDVATYVFVADQLVRRGGATAPGLGMDWRRNLRFVVPVREPEKWSSSQTIGHLERLLGFMSEDNFRFEFAAGKGWSDATDYFEFGGEIEEVVLFSGGLDSLCGAVDRLSTSHSRVVLVSHQSSTKIANRQKELARELGARFEGRILHIPVRVAVRGLKPVETTQRTRSFLFAALGMAVARISGANGFTLFENGIVSLNLPIASQVVGASATRTTHPRVISDLERFLSILLETAVSLRNPFLWKTKSEVAAQLRELGHSDLAKRTVSCSRVYWMTRLKTHCGCCSQCLDRRFGALAAGLGDDDPMEMYGVDLLTGGREEDADRTMAEAFVRHAFELGDLTERTFMNRFAGEIATAASCIGGVSSAEAARRMLDLHRRHGAAVRAVLADGYRQYAEELSKQALPQNCILRLVAAPGTIVVATPAPSIAIDSMGPDTRDFRRSSQLRAALDEVRGRFLIEGIPPIEGTASFALLKRLVETFQLDRNEGRAPENHRYVRTRDLAKIQGGTEESLRRTIYRIRVRVAQAFETEAGLPLSANALIENDRWKGYRINPAVMILAPDQLGKGAGSHGSGQSASRLSSIASITPTT
jgi:7-cyano-7-deazaguanine synthase in queuosine biosynthesis